MVDYSIISLPSLVIAFRQQFYANLATLAVAMLTESQSNNAIRPVQHLPGMWHQQHTFVLSIGPIL